MLSKCPHFKLEEMTFIHTEAEFICAYGYNY